MIPIPIPSTSAEDGSPIGYRYFPAAEQNAPLVGAFTAQVGRGEARTTQGGRGEDRAQPLAVGTRRAIDDDSADASADAFERDSLNLCCL